MNIITGGSCIRIITGSVVNPDSRRKVWDLHRVTEIQFNDNIVKIRHSELGDTNNSNISIFSGQFAVEVLNYSTCPVEECWVHQTAEAYKATAKADEAKKLAEKAKADEVSKGVKQKVNA